MGVVPGWSRSCAGCTEHAPPLLVPRSASTGVGVMLPSRGMVLFVRFWSAVITGSGRWGPPTRLSGIRSPGPAVSSYLILRDPLAIWQVSIDRLQDGVERLPGLFSARADLGKVRVVVGFGSAERQQYRCWWMRCGGARLGGVYR